MLITRMHMKCGALLLLAAATSVPNSTTEAFTTPSTSSTRASATVSSRTSLHGFMDAFKNDDSLAPVQNAGISGKVRDSVIACLWLLTARSMDVLMLRYGHTIFLSPLPFDLSLGDRFFFSFVDYSLIILPSSSSWFLVSHRLLFFFFLFLFLFHHHPAPYTYFTNTQCNVI